LVFDHCHGSQVFRGWLCHVCNKALGAFNDDTELLRKAIQYLELNGKPRVAPYIGTLTIFNSVPDEVWH
jgi:hypothetical protein